MNRPKDPRLLIILVIVALALGAAASWSLVDWSRELSAEARTSGGPSD